jgi:bifunctional ADP-heptose synthase (sugar kinase/adenylyltransferase)
LTELNHTQQQKRFNILLIGDNCIDTYQYGNVDRISPEAPVPIFTHVRDVVLPGMAANVKENLKSFGCAVTFLTAEASVKTRIIDLRSKQQIVRVDKDYIATPLDCDVVDTSQYDAIVISDYNKGLVSYELIEKLRERFSGPIFVDTKKTDLSRLNGCFVKVNQLEYSLLKTVCSNLIVTLGSSGAKWNDIIFPAPLVEVSDVCGAGDTFLSALAYWYLLSNDMAQAIQFAIKASSVTIQHMGVYAPKLEEIL